MQMFLHQQNIMLFRKQLAGRLNQAQRLQLVRLLDEEEAKNPQRQMRNRSLDTRQDGSGDFHE
jgi:hypothetical protein